VDPTDKQIVIVLTGHGLKDPDTAIQMASAPTQISADIEALLAYLG
jgi:threonine synthase